jgi:hypothetical protein
MRIILVGTMALLPIGGVIHAQPDPDFRPVIDRPVYAAPGPRVLVDEGHWNAFTEAEGRGGALRALLTADGYRVDGHQERFTTAALRGVRIVVIAAARGIDWFTLQMNGGQLPDSLRMAPAFRRDEVGALRQWVQDGGGLFLALEHFPYGRTMAGLAAGFGIDVRDGYLADTAHLHRASLPDTIRPNTPMESRVLASRANGLLTEHAITRGRDGSERVSAVVLFGGTSMCGPRGSDVLIRVGPTAEQRIAAGDPGESQALGCGQALAFAFGKGRVVVTGDANGFVTAQERDLGTKRAKVGLGMSDAQNRQFTLNAVHWLSRLAP